MNTITSTSVTHPGLDPETRLWTHSFLSHLADPNTRMWSFFDSNPDTLFVIKARDGRYVFVSNSCVTRCGLTSKAEAIGRTAHDLFPTALADSYVRQDDRILRTGRAVVDNLELTLYRDGSQGWCVSTKIPLFDRAGLIVGIAGMDRDIAENGSALPIDGKFASTIEHLRATFALPQRLHLLARRAGLTPGQFDRRMHRIFGISMMQFIIRLRIDAASRSLAESDDSLADIALSCGFTDQSALSRQFRRMAGVTPRQYRRLMRDGVTCNRRISNDDRRTVATVA